MFNSIRPYFHATSRCFGCEPCLLQGQDIHLSSPFLNCTIQCTLYYLMSILNRNEDLATQRFPLKNYACFLCVLPRHLKLQRALMLCCDLCCSLQSHAVSMPQCFSVFLLSLQTLASLISVRPSPFAV